MPQSAADAAVSAVTSEPALFQAQPPRSRQPEPAPADTGHADGFPYRYKPEANLAEVGVFVGPLFISHDNSFRGPMVINPGSPPIIRPVTRFRQPAVEIGVRGGYYPLSFVGGELEAMLAVAESDADEGATVLAARAQAVAQLPYWSVVPFAVAGFGYWGVLNDVSGNDSDPAFHYGGGAKLNVTRALSVRLDVRDTITNQRGNGAYPHNIEALAGAHLVFGRTRADPKDSDQDHVLDDRDQCPLQAGAMPNGCPVQDSDGDGIPNLDDQCDMELGVAPTGCPIRDADQDGVVDADDECVSEKGGAPTGCADGDQDGFPDRSDQCPAASGSAPDGCPQDADEDGLTGADDHCPDQAETKNDFEDSDGCPDQLPQAVENFVGVIAGIEFDSNQATIRPGSAAALDQAASVLSEYPNLRIEIIGHTDNQGSREFNIDLSLRRAESVKAHLLAKGIDPSRIETKGEGPNVPLTTNDTQTGRQQNRRIEFRIIQ